MTVESVVLMLACVGSIGWIGFLFHYYARRPDEAIRQRDNQIARLLEEIKLQKERAEKEVADLKELLKKKGDKIIDLSSRLRVAEMRLSVGGPDELDADDSLDSFDPLVAIWAEAEEKAKAYLVEACRLRMAAVEATGKEKARLLAKAEELEAKAAELQGIADAKKRIQSAAPAAKKRPHHSKPHGKEKAAPDFEVVA